LLPETTSERVPLERAGRRIGCVTSATWSPSLKRMIALGSVGAAHAEPGTRMEVEWMVQGYRHHVGATVVPLPFLDLPRKRS